MQPLYIGLAYKDAKVCITGFNPDYKVAAKERVPEAEVMTFNLFAPNIKKERNKIMIWLSEQGLVMIEIQDMICEIGAAIQELIDECPSVTSS